MRLGGNEDLASENFDVQIVGQATGPSETSSMKGTQANLMLPQVTRLESGLHRTMADDEDKENIPPHLTSGTPRRSRIIKSSPRSMPSPAHKKVARSFRATENGVASHSPARPVAGMTSNITSGFLGDIMNARPHRTVMPQK